MAELEERRGRNGELIVAIRGRRRTRELSQPPPQRSNSSGSDEPIVKIVAFCIIVFFVAGVILLATMRNKPGKEWFVVAIDNDLNQPLKYQFCGLNKSEWEQTTINPKSGHIYSSTDKFNLVVQIIMDGIEYTQTIPAEFIRLNDDRNEILDKTNDGYKGIFRIDANGDFSFQRYKEYKVAFVKNENINLFKYEVNFSDENRWHADDLEYNWFRVLLLTSGKNARLRYFSDRGVSNQVTIDIQKCVLLKLDHDEKKAIQEALMIGKKDLASYNNGVYRARISDKKQISVH